MAYQLHPITAAGAAVDPLQSITDVVFVGDDGNPVDIANGGSVAWDDVTGKPETFPVRKAEATSVVTAAAATAPAALTSAAAAGDAPTKVEYDKVVADLAALRSTVASLVTLSNALRTSTNGVINSMREAGLAEGNAS